MALGECLSELCSYRGSAFAGTFQPTASPLKLQFILLNGVHREHPSTATHSIAITQTNAVAPAAFR